MTIDARAAYRRKMQQRRTVLFGSIAIVLAVLMILSMLIWTGIIPTPKKDFTSKIKTIVPCLSDGTTPVEPSSINVNVYNATRGSGLASNAGSSLAQLGFVVERTDNWSGSSKVEKTQIITGAGGVAEAYSLQRYIPDSVVQFDSNITGSSVSLVLGNEFRDKVSNDQPTVLDAATVATNNPSGTLVSPKNCENVTD